MRDVTTPSDPLPFALADAHALILSLRDTLVVERSEALVRRLENEKLKLLIAKLRREQFGQSSERGKLLVEQLELAIEDLEESQAAVEAETDLAVPDAVKTRPESSRTRSRPTIPADLPVERIVYPAPCTCDTMRRGASAQARRDRVENPRMRAAPMEGDRACPPEGDVPRLRGHHRDTGPVTSDSARLCRPDTFSPACSCRSSCCISR